MEVQRLSVFQSNRTETLFRSCLLLERLSEFRKKYKPDAALLKTVHNRARSIPLQDDRHKYGTKRVKVLTNKETTVVLRVAHINEASSHFQRLKILGSAQGSLSMGIPAFLGGFSGVVHELLQDLIHFQRYIFSSITSRIQFTRSL